MNRRERMMEDLDQDIRTHIEMETQDNIERGMSPEEGSIFGFAQVWQHNRSSRRDMGGVEFPLA